MAIFDLHVPSLGESVTEATIARWVKNDGDVVGPDEVVAELETDKSVVELPAGKAGALKVVRPKGQTVKVGDVIARIDPEAKAASAPAAPAQDGAAKGAATATAAGPAGQQVAPAARGGGGGTPQPVATAQTGSTATPASREAARDTKIEGKDITPGVVCDLKQVTLEDLSPAVRALVMEHGLTSARIPATGPKGNLTKEDVLNYISRNGPQNVVDAQRTQSAARTQQAVPQMPAVGTTSVPDRAAHAGAAPPAAPQGEEIRTEMSKLRQTIAQRLVQAQHTTASLTTFNEIDMSAVMALREKYKERFEKAYGIGLGFMSFFAKAVIQALKAVPNVNASIDGTALVQRKYVNLGIAVSTDRGLMVPVLKNAHLMSMAQVESEIKRLATKARDGKISPDDMAGGTFTITNGGVFGSLLSTPILNPPQSGILGMHKIEKRAVVVSEGKEDRIVVRPMMYVALTYDHRVIDGQQSVTFLVKVKEALEDPARLVLEI